MGISEEVVSPLCSIVAQRHCHGTLQERRS